MSTYVNNLALEEIGTGERSGTWGTATNTNLQLIGEAFGYGTEAIANSATANITMGNATTDEIRKFYVKITGVLGQDCTITLKENYISKVWIFENATTGGNGFNIIMSQGTGASVTIPNGHVKMVATDGNGSGAIVYDLLTDLSVAGSFQVDGGVLDVKNTGSQSVVRFYCENANQHYAELKAPLHSDLASGNATLTLPSGTGNIISDISVNTLTNKTLTAPKFAAAGFIADSNYSDGDAGSKHLVFQQVASSINHFEMTNAATGNGVALASVGGDSNINMALTAKGTGNVTVDGNAVSTTGKQTMWVPAAAMYPRTTNGCSALAQTEINAAVAYPEIKTLDFNKDADQNAQFAVAFPKSWNEGTVSFQVFFTANSTNTGGVRWFLQGLAVSDNDPIGGTFGTAVAPVAKAHSGVANDLDVTAESGATTIAGTPAESDQCFFQIYRDVSDAGDTLTADAKLLGIKFFFTTNAYNDA